MVTNEGAIFKKRMQWPMAFILLLWVIHLVKVIFDLDLGNWGIYPLHTEGLPGIITAPLIHADFKHLLSNSVPLLGMLAIMVLFYPTVALRSFMLIYFLTGLSVWLFGRNVFHIGASGVVYGLVAFVFWSGVFRRSLKSIILALIIVILYTPMFAGILPSQEGISWESHLLGAIVGVFTSFYYKKELEVDEMEKENHIIDEDELMETQNYFLPRDVFEKTKEERKEPYDHNSRWVSNSSF